MKKFLQGKENIRVFPDTKNRTSACFVSPNHFISQFLTEHRAFKAKLTSLNIITEEAYECGEKDTVSHHIVDCPIFEPQRMALEEILRDRN